MLRHRLTDEQWNLISDVFSEPKRTGRPPRERRQVMDGIPLDSAHGFAVA